MPTGTILDGEIVRWRGDRLDFAALQLRYASRRRTPAHPGAPRCDGDERRTTIELVAVSPEGLRGTPAQASFSWT